MIHKQKAKFIKTKVDQVTLTFRLIYGLFGYPQTDDIIQRDP